MPCQIADKRLGAVVAIALGSVDQIGAGCPPFSFLWFNRRIAIDDCEEFRADDREANPPPKGRGFNIVDQSQHL